MNIETASDWLKAIKEKYIHGGDESYDEQRKEAIDFAIKTMNDQQHEIWELQELVERLRDNQHLDSRHLSLLKLALKTGWAVINTAKDCLEYCDDARDDYFLMSEKLGEMIGENLDDTRD